MEPETKTNGAFVGLAVIIIILIIGGTYIWQSNKDALKLQKESTVTEEDSQDLYNLQMDANATDASTGVDANAVN